MGDCYPWGRRACCRSGLAREEALETARSFAGKPAHRVQRGVQVVADFGAGTLAAPVT